MKCSNISEKISKFFHGLIFVNLKITEITKIILAAINFREGTHLKTSDLYQNMKVLLKSFRAIWKSLPLSSTWIFKREGKEKINTEKRLTANLYLLFHPLTTKSVYYAHKDASKCFHCKQNNAWTFYEYQESEGDGVRFVLEAPTSKLFSPISRQLKG